MSVVFVLNSPDVAVQSLLIACVVLCWSAVPVAGGGVALQAGMEASWEAEEDTGEMSLTDSPTQGRLRALK